MEVTILGAGVPTPTSTRFGSSYLVNVGSELLMIDCGPAATYKLVQAGFWPTRINHLFFTHHHFDHNADYPCFLLTRWDQCIGEEETLKVFGPAPTSLLTDRLLNEDYGAFSCDWKARVGAALSQRVYVNRGGTLPRQAPAVDTEDIEPGFICERDGWRITAAATQHVQPYLDSVAYRIDAAGESLVLTGDTQPCESVKELARGADTLICMCWDLEDEMEANGENVGQSGTRSAATIARDAGVGRLVMTHMGPRLASHGPLERGIEQVGQIFSGEVVVGEELVTIPVAGTDGRS